MGNKNLLESFNCAIDGLVYCYRTQKNMRIHFFITILVLFASLWLHISKFELLLVFFSIILVLFAEAINTAIEVTIDLITQEYHPLAAIAKDVAAGAVLLAALNSLVTGYIVFFPKLTPVLPKVIENIRTSPAHITIIALFIVILSVILFKIYTKTGRPFSGGMPSGHAAVAFALSTAIILISRDGVVASFVLILSLMVAQSRVEGKIHSLLEVIIGSLLGILLTLLIFQLYQ